jgi:hypothetical protein
MHCSSAPACPHQAQTLHGCDPSYVRYGGALMPAIEYMPTSPVSSATRKLFVEHILASLPDPLVWPVRSKARPDHYVP